jgi:hypothetical protein
VCFADKKQDAKTCGINHRGDEFILELNSFYILAKTSPVQQAFPSPILDVTCPTMPNWTQSSLGF